MANVMRRCMASSRSKGRFVARMIMPTYWIALSFQRLSKGYLYQLSAASHTFPSASSRNDKINAFGRKPSTSFRRHSSFRVSEFRVAALVVGLQLSQT